MAEGDSIHRLARRLTPKLVGRTVTASKFNTPTLATSSLNEFAFRDVLAIGKHLLFRLHHAEQGDWTIHSHLRMEGEWAPIGPSKHLPRKREDDVRCHLQLDDESHLYGLKLPVLELVSMDHESDVVGHLGPDILGKGFEPRRGAERFTADERPVVETLLDQRLVCGIGNLWAVEVLFLRGIFPWKPAIDVDIVGILRLAQKMMLYSLNVKAGMITTGNTRKGETHWVYGRYRRPCRRCGTPIDFRPGGSGPYDRETWWCPHCQPV